MPTMYVYLNDNLVTESSATIPITDRGFLYGDGIFETLLARNGIPYTLNEHLNRLAQGAHITGIPMPSKTMLQHAIEKLLKKNNLTHDAYIRITLSRGSGGTRLSPNLSAPPTLLIVAKAHTPLPQSSYTTGFKTILVSPQRNTQSPESGIKSLNYLPNILGKIEAERVRCHEGIMCNEKGDLACGTVSNIFFIKDNHIITPPLSAGILPGITRHIIINELAPTLKIPLLQQHITPAQIHTMDAAFVTNSLWGIMPLHTFNKTTYAESDSLKRLQKAYNHLIKN